MISFVDPLLPQANVERRERLRKLALETVDLNKDPYFLRNHLGTYVSNSPWYQLISSSGPRLHVAHA